MRAIQTFETNAHHFTSPYLIARRHIPYLGKYIRHHLQRINVPCAMMSQSQFLAPLHTAVIAHHDLLTSEEFHVVLPLHTVVAR